MGAEEVSFFEVLKPDTITRDDLTRHSITIPNNGVRTAITSYGSRDERVGTFLRQFGESDHEELTEAFRHNPELYEYLSALVCPDLGVEDLAEELLGEHIRIEWDNTSVVDKDGYYDNRDILYLILAEAENYRIVTVGYDNDNGDLAGKAFNQAAEWSREIWESASPVTK